MEMLLLALIPNHSASAALSVWLQPGLDEFLEEELLTQFGKACWLLLVVSRVEYFISNVIIMSEIERPGQPMYLRRACVKGL